MISKNLMASLEGLGFNLSNCQSSNKTHAYAVYGGYMISVYESMGKKIAYFNFKFVDDSENGLKQYDMSENFNSRMCDYNITDYSISDDGMRVSFSGGIPQFLKLIDSCVEFLTENEIRGVGYCSNCGNKLGSKNPKMVTNGNENMLMCVHCALESIELSKNATKSVSAATKKDIGLGALGSVAFSFLGAVLYFLVYYYLLPAISKSDFNDAKYIFCALGAVVALLSYIGYRIFCKAPSKAGYYIIGANALVFTAIGQYLGVVFEFVAKSNFKISVLSNKAFWLIHLRNTIPTDVAANYTDYSSIFYKMLAFSLMFAIVGAAIFLLTLHDKTSAKKETAVVETIKL